MDDQHPDIIHGCSSRSPGDARYYLSLACKMLPCISLAAAKSPIPAPQKEISGTLASRDTYGRSPVRLRAAWQGLMENGGTERMLRGRSGLARSLLMMMTMTTMMIKGSW